MRDEKDLIDLNNLIIAICMRPGMYVRTADFRMIESFINGFAYAKDFDVIRDFGYWIGVKFNLPRNVVWCDNLEKIFSNDEEILRELPKLFEEFKNSKENLTGIKIMNRDEK